MAGDCWETALQELDGRDTAIYGPKSFNGYLREIGEDPRDYRTAAEISLDTYRDLPRVLRQHDTMVLRLGSSPSGRGTQFALVKVEGRLDDFFIHERGGSEGSRKNLDFSPNGADIDLLDRTARDMLEAYRILPNFSESSFVNLALSTGVLSRALDLDDESIGTAPTTIASTFDFEFEPHTRQRERLHHNNGQVEIDGVVITRRHGRRVMVVLEAKSGRKSPLAKHKLLYPFLAMESRAPPSVTEIVPVYLQSYMEDQRLMYDIYECEVQSPDRRRPCMDELKVVNTSHYSLNIH